MTDLSHPQNRTVIAIKTGTLTGVNGLSSASFSVYPNPSAGKFILDGAKRGTDLKIFNVFGVCIFHSSEYINSIAIDLSGKPDGIYFLQVADESGTAMKKLVINK